MIIAIVFIVVSIAVFFWKTLKSEINKSNSHLGKNDEIKSRIENLKIDMIQYMETGQTEYTEKDVKKCFDLLNAFLIELEKTETKETGMKVVEKVVLKLNELNEKCEHELIETDQREQLAEIIILAGNLKGYNEKDEDITEEWREW